MQDKETKIGQFKPAFSGPIPNKETIILKREDTPKALALLVITSGPYAGTTLPLKEGVTRIGRDGRRNDHVIDDDAASDIHLSIRYRDGAFIATDLDSTNGTKVNGKSIDRQTLAPNDAIEIGNTRLTFVQVSDAGAKAEV